MVVCTKQKRYAAVQLTAGNLLTVIEKVFDQMASVNVNPPMLVLSTVEDGYKNVPAGWYLLFNEDGKVALAKSENELKAEFDMEAE